MICDDSAKITGISTGKSGPKLCTLFEATWSLLLHLHFVLLCNPIDYIAAKAFDASSSHMSMGPDGLLKDPKDDAPGERPSGPRRSITMNSVQAAANAKQMLEKQYGERGSRLSVTEKRSGRSSTVIGGRVDPAVTKNVLAAVHETLKLLLDQSMHCMFSPQSTTFCPATTATKSYFKFSWRALASTSQTPRTSPTIRPRHQRALFDSPLSFLLLPHPTPPLS